MAGSVLGVAAPPPEVGNEQFFEELVLGIPEMAGRKCTGK